MQDHGYRVIPVNPTYQRGARAAMLPGPRVHSRARRHRRLLSQAGRDGGPRARRRGDRRQGAVDAARHPQRRGRADRRRKPGSTSCMDRCVKIEHARHDGRAQLGGREHGRHQCPPARRVESRPMPDHAFGFDTLCLHAGQIPDAQPAPARCRSTRRRRSSSTARTTPRRCSICRRSATSTRASPTRPSRRSRSASPRSKGGRAALAAATGMAAQMLALLTLARAGRPHRRVAHALRRQLFAARRDVRAVRHRHHVRRCRRAGQLPRRDAPEHQGRVRRDHRQPAAQRGRPRRARGHRARRGRAAGRRQHARLALPLPAHRARRRHRRAFGHEVSRRPRHHDGRRARRVGQVPVGQRQVPA